MMTIWQNFTIAYRRISKNWSRYALIMLLFALPVFLSEILGAVTRTIIEVRTGFAENDFYYIFMLNLAGNLSQEMISELEIDINLINRTMAAVLPYSIASAAVMLLSLMVNLPVAAYYLGIARQNRVTLGEAFKLAFKSIPLTLLMGIKIFLWSLLFIIPGIIKAFAYSQAYYIKADNPSWSSGQCIKHSIKVTQGRKGRLFLLMLVLGLASGLASGIIVGILGVGTGLIFGFLSAAKYTIVYNSVFTLASIVFEMYYLVFYNTSIAIFYEDARRAYIDDVEQDLRYRHDSGSYGENHSNPFNDDKKSENGGKNDGDPFGM